MEQPASRATSLIVTFCIKYPEMVSFVQEAASRIPAVIQFGKDVQPSEGWIRIFKQSDREPESAFYCSIYCMFSENTTGFTGRCQDYAKSCFVIRDHSETTKAKRILQIKIKEAFGIKDKTSSDKTRRCDI